ncbi:MAG: SDR family oxidoreductase [Alphaproteobacteria bacterium]|nr:SDR family oxidoreductase [Alphaproteobacteria bacterium]
MNTPYALISGASDGIGFELAKLFIQADYNLVIVSDNMTKLKKAEAQLQQFSAGHKIEIIESDLAAPEGAKFVFDSVMERGIEIEVLVNNAGVGVYGDFASETNLKEEMRMLQLNTFSVVALSKYFVRGMVQRGSGKILITSSIAGMSGAPWLTVYGATKAFDYIFALGLREELKDTGVTVTALLPSQTDTNFFNRADMENSKITETKMADPAKVAKAGFDALMENDGHVASPLRSKFMASLANFVPDELMTHFAEKQQKPINH